MNKVPKMISTKDLDYICDILNWNFIAAKKANHYEKESNGEDVQTFFRKLNAMYKEHYDFILDLIK